MSLKEEIVWLKKKIGEYIVIFKLVSSYSYMEKNSGGSDKWLFTFL
jgi:hypothetical protein